MEIIRTVKLMGNSIGISEKKEFRILMMGTWCAGKTTLLYHLQKQPSMNIQSTCSFNYEEVTYKDKVFTIWDIGDRYKAWLLYCHYYQNT